MFQVGHPNFLFCRTLSDNCRPRRTASQRVSRIVLLNYFIFYKSRCGFLFCWFWWLRRFAHPSYLSQAGRNNYSTPYVFSVTNSAGTSLHAATSLASREGYDRSWEVRPVESGKLPTTEMEWFSSGRVHRSSRVSRSVCPGWPNQHCGFVASLRLFGVTEDLRPIWGTSAAITLKWHAQPPIG